MYAVMSQTARAPGPAWAIANWVAEDAHAMAKKTLNPADAHRKAQRKKELKKNKADRSKARDFALVKKDTTELEDEIEQLEKQAAEPGGKPNPRLNEAKAELEKINAKKAEYVEEHPEARRLVYKGKRREGEKDEEEKNPLPANRNMFDKKGLPRHPERSIYYDPVMNPYGVAPPGMPYMERPLLPGEVNSDVEMEDSDDEDIPLPPGPPPGSEFVQDDEDIPLPEGPPPGTAVPSVGDPTLPHLPPGPPPPHAFMNTAAFAVLPPPPPGFPVTGTPGLPLLPVGFPPHAGTRGIPPPPVGFPPSAATPGLPPPPLGMPPPLAGFPPNARLAGFPPPFPGMPAPPMGFAPNTTGGVPPPPPGFLPHFPNFPPPGAHFSHGLPAPPPGFFPRKSQSAGSIQDPLSSVPHKTFQAHKATQQASKPHPSLPARPAAATVALNATVEAAPELRDFKKEATAFVPAAVKRKKAGAGVGHAPAINAAPSVGDVGVDKPAEGNVDSGPARPDLVSTLRNQFPMPLSKQGSKPKDDYAKFVEEMGDILG